MADQAGEEKRMSRYEGMEDLLQRVRDRMEMAAVAPHPALVFARDIPSPTSYERLLEMALLTLHHTEQLRDVLNSENAALTPEQHGDLTAILGKVDRQLEWSRAALQRAQPSEPV
ncbi:MAG: hypothetical protein NVS4B2_29340 [Chloroflexota bacterium]